jgi:DNA mismatch endonuclease (patch repair protein)
MADTLSPEARSERMGRIKAKDSQAELAVRSMVHRLGFRFRLHRRDLPGCPDLAFPRLKRVIFVHGCFWHRHPSPDCKLGRMPKSRLDFWAAKLNGNRERDLRNLAKLEALGWSALVVWECELANKEHVRNMIREFLEGHEAAEAAAR